MAPTLNAVTGVFGYTGKYIARRLLARGETVVTLTSKQDRSNEFGGLVKAFPYRFDSPGTHGGSTRRSSRALQHILGALRPR